MTGRSITFARPADRSKALAKVMHVDWSAEWPLIQRVDPSPNFTMHRFRTRRFTDLADVLLALRGAARSGEIMVRGEPRREVGRRAIHDDVEKGPAGLDVVPRVLMALDWDQLPGRAKLTNGEPADPLLNPEAFILEAMECLPRDWRDKDCIVQVSASAGLKGVRLRTFHLLAEPLTGKQLKLWLKPAIERGILDPCTLVECQPIYLGITVVGGHDPCPERFVMHRQGVGEIIPVEGYRRAAERQEKIEATEKARRARWAASRPKGDDKDLTERAIRRCERAIAGAGSGARHPAYMEQMARARAIIDRHGGADWNATAERLKAAYLSTLTTAEAAQRKRGSTEGVARWLEGRP